MSIKIKVIIIYIKYVSIKVIVVFNIYKIWNIRVNNMGIYIKFLNIIVGIKILLIFLFKFN